jgi:hypothetical protein
MVRASSAAPGSLVPRTDRPRSAEMACTQPPREPLLRPFIKPLPLLEAVCRHEARRFLKDARQVELVSTVSVLALMVEIPFTSDNVLVKNGTNPQRIITSSREPVSLSLRMTGWKVVAARTSAA